MYNPLAQKRIIRVPDTHKTKSGKILPAFRAVADGAMKAKLPEHGAREIRRALKRRQKNGN